MSWRMALLWDQRCGHTCSLRALSRWFDSLVRSSGSHTSHADTDKRSAFKGSPRRTKDLATALNADPVTDQLSDHDLHLFRRRRPGHRCKSAGTSAGIRDAGCCCVAGCCGGTNCCEAAGTGPDVAWSGAPSAARTPTGSRGCRRRRWRGWWLN